MVAEVAKPKLLFRVEARVLESGISVVATYGRLPLLQFVKLDLVKLATDLYLIIGAIQFPFSPPYKGLKLTIWLNCKTITPHSRHHVLQTNKIVCKILEIVLMTLL